MKKKIIAIAMMLTMAFPTVSAYAETHEDSKTIDFEQSVVSKDIENNKLDLIEEYIEEYILKTETLDAQLKETDLNSNIASFNVIDDTEISELKDEIRSDTVEKLNMAGIEAYDVNTQTFESVEEVLNTDFEELGLDKECSYIITVSGESDNDNELSSRLTVGSSFNHTYGGTTYQLRYLTITAADDSSYGKATTVNLLNSSSETLIVNCLNTAILTTISSINTPLGVVASICGLDVSKINTARTMTLNTNCGTNWTRVHTQVYSSYDKMWLTGSSVEYVKATSTLSGQYYNKSNNIYTSVPQNPKTTTKYSSKYYDATWKKDQAVAGYKISVIKWDTVGSVQYKYGGATKVTHMANF